MKSDQKHILTEPLKLPFCPCGDPHCTELRVIADHTFAFLYEQLQDATSQGVVITMMASRVLVQLGMHPTEAEAMLRNNMFSTFGLMLKEQGEANRPRAV